MRNASTRTRLTHDRERSTTMSSTMSSTTERRLALPALALVAALSLAACGDDAQDAAGPSSSEHGSGHSTDSTNDDAKGNDADISFLTGMTPHHEQAVEMSEIVLAANPPGSVAAIARQIKGAQAPEIERMDEMLAALGEKTDAGHGERHSAGHGMMSEQDMAELKSATGIEAARLYLEGMIAHHEGAIQASEKEIADGKYGPAVELAREIKTAQAEEIIEMQALLTSL
jgi:uncharacterized protein (DUF305 family)